MTATPTRYPHVSTAGALRLRVADLCVDRGGRRVLDRLSFALEGGEALLVTGRNGAGKSTLLRCLAGLLPRAGGSVGIDGTDPGELPTLVHYLAHADGLKTALTVNENLEFWARFLERNEAQRPGISVAEALARMGLAQLGDAPVAILSAGQKRRVALARLLVSNRPLWLLDEPTSALDRASRERLARLMAEHRGAGGVIIAATHEPLGLADARELALGGLA